MALHPNGGFAFDTPTSVDIYHASLPSVRVELEDEFTHSSIKSFFLKMAQLDADRIHRVLLPSTNSTALLGPPTARVNDQTRALMVTTTLYEVLSTRRLLSDFRIVHLISKVRRIEDLRASLSQ